MIYITKNTFSIGTCSREMITFHVSPSPAVTANIVGTMHACSEILPKNGNTLKNKASLK